MYNQPQEELNSITRLFGFLFFRAHSANIASSKLVCAFYLVSARYCERQSGEKSHDKDADKVSAR